MKNKLVMFSLLVDDYDKAIEYYTKTLCFTLVEDTKMSETKRWVVVTPGDSGSSILLAKAANDEQKSRIGNQTGGRVFLFLHTDDFSTYYSRLKSNQVRFVREPVQESWGMVAVFQDVYGNLWDLIQPAT
ncbi:MAG: VOC family protein [Bacteroidia bacterium]